MRRYKRRKKRRIMMLMMAFFIVGIGIFVANKIVIPKWSSYDSKNIKKEHGSENRDQEWNLILVNHDNYIPNDYEVELIELSNGEKVDSRIYPGLQDMFDAARADGLALYVASGYRTKEEQQQLLDEKIAAYENEGYSDAKAEKLAKEWVAIPGTSEHQLGMAVDINADENYSSSDDVYIWLEENGYKYGFIQRYPNDKTEITGTIYEPWHYRYVGKEAAEEMYSKGICLEEYLEMLE